MSAHDPGRQPERTALAWDRTALALAANAALVVRTGMRDHSAALLAAGMVLVGLAAALAAAGLVRRLQLASRQPRAPAAALIGLTTAATVLAGACGGWGLLLQ